MATKADPRRIPKPKSNTDSPAANMGAGMMNGAPSTAGGQGTRGSQRAKEPGGMNMRPFKQGKSAHTRRAPNRNQNA